MNKTEYIGKLNALYVGDKNCLEELITAYDEKDKEIERLNNIIDKAIEFIKNNTRYNEYGCIDDLEYDNCDDLLKILKGSDKE